MSGRSQFPAVALKIGIGCLVVSFLWARLIDGYSHWTDSDAQEYAQTASKLHQLTEEAGKIERAVALQAAAKQDAATKQGAKKPAKTVAPPPPVDPHAAEKVAAERQEVLERYRQQRAELENSRAGGSLFSKTIYWVGIFALLAAAGEFGYQTWKATRRYK